MLEITRVFIFLSQGVKELSQATEADVENVDLEHSQLTSHASLDDNSKATPAHVETDFHFFSDTEVTKWAGLLIIIVI